MKSVLKGMRLTRYNLKEGHPVKFIFETPTGKKLEGNLLNCSLSGVGLFIESNEDNLSDFEVGDIFPASKIAWEGHEYTLGRMVLRAKQPEGSQIFIGLSTIDSRIPLDGDLSRYLDIDLNAHKGAHEYELGTEAFSTANFMEGTNNVDLFHRCRQYKVYFEDWTKNGQFEYRNVRVKSKGKRINLKRTRTGNKSDYVNLGSNDYLGFSARPEVIEAAKKAIDEYGSFSTGSAILTGMTELHTELADRLARIFKKERVLLYNSGYAANVGLISGLTRNQDLILSDYLSHMSIRDGMDLSQADSRYFKHNNMEHLRKLLEENRDSHSGCLLTSEGVFSMDGDVAPLKDLIKIAKEFNCRTMIDEAHSFGVIGKKGFGLCEAENALDDVDIVMGTLSKTLCSAGGFVAASEEVIDWLWWFSHSHMFSVSMPPAAVGASLAALDILQKEPQVVEKLHSNIKHFIEGLIHLGFPMNKDHASAVVPLVIGDEEKMLKMNQIMMDAGVWSIYVVYPAVSRRGCRFRFVVTADHDQAELDLALAILEKAMKEVGFDPKDVPVIDKRYKAA